jgi:NAD(P)-dependent dehydrogenase (short-subunit alcohol dehydrogenase family)
MPGSVVIVGGTSGIGHAIARYAGDGRHVVITGRDAERGKRRSGNRPRRCGLRGVRVDLAEPAAIGAALADVGEVDRLGAGRDRA